LGIFTQNLGFYLIFFGSVEYIGFFEEIYENFDEDERKDGRR
jgi:hypothetical protein